MTDLEISQALALSIGWQQALRSSQGIVVQTHREHDRVKSNGRWLYHWRVFDYRDWAVIGPIAERYDCFPFRTREGYWIAWNSSVSTWDTPQKAVAMAIINGAKHD